MTQLPLLIASAGWPVAGLLFLTTLVPAFATTRDHETLQNQIQRIGDELQTLDKDRKSLEKTLTTLERRIAEKAGELRALEPRIRRIRQRRHDLMQTRRRQRQRLSALKERLAAHIRAAYALGRVPPLKLLFHLEDLTSLSRVFTYYRYLNRARLAQIGQTRKHLEEIRRVDADLQRSRQKLAMLYDHRAGELAELQSLYRQRQRILVRIQAQLSDQRHRLARLEADKQRLGHLLTSVHSATSNLAFPGSGNRAFHELRGHFHWPVTGRLVTRFGSPRGGGRWEGVVIRTPEGTPVKVIYPGWVVFADWLRGYGFLIIIRHNRDFMTLYAYNQILMKHVGDRVEAGEVIATVGRSGGHSQPGLYFAIRYRDKPVDPLRWCRHPKQGRVS